MDVKELTPTLIELLADPKCPYMYIKELGQIISYPVRFALYIDPKTNYYTRAIVGCEFRAYDFKNIKPKKTDEEAGIYIKELYEKYKNKSIQWNIKNKMNSQPIFLRYSQRVLDNIDLKRSNQDKLVEYITDFRAYGYTNFNDCDNIKWEHYGAEYSYIKNIFNVTNNPENIPLFVIRNDHPYKEVELDKISDKLKQIQLKLAEIAIKTELDNISWVPDGQPHEAFFEL